MKQKNKGQSSFSNNLFPSSKAFISERVRVMGCRRREQQTAKLRKTAEKMLMAQLRKHALTQANQHISEGDLIPCS